MGHRIDNDVDPHSICSKPILERIARIVYPFPRISEVAVTRDERKQPALFVLYTHIVRNNAAFLMSYTATQPRTDARHLDDFLDIKVTVKE